MSLAINNYYVFSCLERRANWCALVGYEYTSQVMKAFGGLWFMACTWHCIIKHIMCKQTFCRLPFLCCYVAFFQTAVLAGQEYFVQIPNSWKEGNSAWRLWGGSLFLIHLRKIKMNFQPLPLCRESWTNSSRYTKKWDLSGNKEGAQSFSVF